VKKHLYFDVPSLLDTPQMMISFIFISTVYLVGSILGFGFKLGEGGAGRRFSPDLLIAACLVMPNERLPESL